jgi:hypothetical protein
LLRENARHEGTAAVAPGSQPMNMTALNRAAAGGRPYGHGSFIRDPGAIPALFRPYPPSPHAILRCLGA